MAARTAYQIFKALGGAEAQSKSAIEFTAMPADATTPYRCKAVEEKAQLLVKACEDSSGTGSTAAVSVTSLASLAHVMSEYLHLAAAQGPPPVSPAAASPAAAKTSQRGRGSKRGSQTASHDASNAGPPPAAKYYVRVDWGLINNAKQLLSLNGAAAASAAASAVPDDEAKAMAECEAAFRAESTKLKKRARTEKDANGDGDDVVKSRRIQDMRTAAAARQTHDDEQPADPRDEGSSRESAAAATATAPAAAAAAAASAPAPAAAPAAPVAPKAAPQKRPRAPRAASASAGPIVGRLRALTTQEKRLVGALSTVIDALAVEFGARTNRMQEVFAKVREGIQAAAAVIEKADSAAADATSPTGPPSTLQEVNLKPLLDAVSASENAFLRDDEECQLLFDEDLLHPIAHECLTIINRIEGFVAPPPRVVTEKDKEEKKTARAAAKTKLDEAKHKADDKAREREKAAALREAERKALKSRLSRGVDIDALVEDKEIANNAPLGYVSYTDLQPSDPILFDQALSVWSFIVSVPRALRLSQMSFSLFSTSLVDDNSENAIMEEVFRALLNVCVAAKIATPGVPNATPAIATPRMQLRGKSWFEAATEFISVTSGNKKKKPVAKKKAVASPPSSSSDDDSDDSSNSSDSDDSSSSDESSSSSSESSSSSSDEKESKKKADDSNDNKKAGDDDGNTSPKKAASQEPEPQAGTLEADLRETMTHLASLRSMACWANLEIPQRLSLLRYMVQYAIETPAVRQDVEKLSTELETLQNATEKKIKEYREEAEREVKLVGKPERAKAPLPPSSPNAPKESPTPVQPPPVVDPAARKAQIIENMQAQVKAAIVAETAVADGEDKGARIRPLGEDRYHRMFWRFPMDRCVRVMTTAQTDAAFPLVPKPQAETEGTTPAAASGRAGKLRNFLDDDEAPQPPKRGARGTAAAAASATATPALTAPTEPQQRMWGVITADQLPQFIATLDRRGRREALLRERLEALVDYLAGLSAEPEGGHMMTRSRRATHGYLNKFKAD